MADQPTHLDPSELGTKSYWDDAYDREIRNHLTSPDDEGTVWFSDSGAEEKMVDYLEKLSEEGVLHKEAERLGLRATSLLDLGTGNGHLLFALRDEGWSGLMVGVDYSSKSVALARQIGESRAKARSEALEAADDTDEAGEDDDDPTNGSWASVRFEEYDLLSGELPPGQPPQGFDVLLDKGTFDAISLADAKDAAGRRICEGYRDRVLPLLHDGGLFLITSCNWTEPELRKWFESAEDAAGEGFVLRDRIKYPSYTFGGQTGQSVVTLCFVKATQ